MNKYNVHYNKKIVISIHNNFHTPLPYYNIPLLLRYAQLLTVLYKLLQLFLARTSQELAVCAHCPEQRNLDMKKCPVH